MSDFIIAGEYPVKTLRFFLHSSRRIEPVHASFNITNRCQLKCPYCSTRNRPQSPDMKFTTYVKILDAFSAFPLSAVTFTGGGEPLMHPEFPRFVAEAKERNLRLALITNGVSANKHRDLLKDFDWIRVSFDGYRAHFPDIPPDLSYGVSFLYEKGDENKPQLQQVLDMAKSKTITHLRIGPDIEKAHQISVPDSVRNVSRVVVQDRRQYYRGTSRCWIGLIRPKIDVNGEFYPCCGVQYALRYQSEPYPADLKIGSLKDFMALVETQTPFDASICFRCYYMKNNNLLDAIHRLDHVRDPAFL